MIRLRELREKNNLTQLQVAEAIGKSMQAYSHYELGRREPDIETLKKLSDLYDVSIDYLLGKTKTPIVTILGGAKSDPSIINKELEPDQEAIELARQIKNLPPEQRGVIEQQIKIWHSLDKKD